MGGRQTRPIEIDFIPQKRITMQRIIETITYVIEKPAARRMRLAKEHAARRAQRIARERAQETRQDRRNPYPFHV